MKINLSKTKVSLVLSGLLLGSSLSGATLTWTADTALNQTLASNSDLTIPTGTNTISSVNEAAYINGTSAYNMSVINNGTLNLTSVMYGIRYVGTTAGSSIQNNGTINLTNLSGTAYGIASTYKTSDTIENTGTLSVNALTTAYGIYLYTASTTGTITNSGTISAKKNGEFDSSAYSLNYGGSTNAITVNNSGTMNGNILLGKGTLTNTGTISLPHNATSARIENYINQGTGKLEIGLQTDGTTTTYSKLSTTSATFNDGSTINVNVLSSSTNVGTLAGTTFADVVSASTALTINGTLNITDNSALLDFTYTEDGETIDLTAVQAQSVEETVQRITGNNSNAKAAAGTLQKIVDNSSSYTQMNGVVSALNALSTNEQVASAVDSTTPQTTTSSFTASNQISNNISNIVSQRQTITMNSATGSNSGDELLASKNVWIKPYGSLGSQSDKDGVNGFDIGTYGIGIGVDGEYKKDKQMGAGFFYTNADVDVNNVSQNSDIDVYSLIFYGKEPIIDDRTNFLYQLGYSWQDTSSQRDIAFMNTSATADYTSQVASIDLKVLRDYQINNDLLLQPLVSTTYRYFKSPNYSENGAGSLNLDVDKFSSDELILGIGTLGYYKINSSSRMFGNVNVGYDVIDDNNIVSSSYQGASGLSFETKGIDNGRWSYDLGLGYENDITELSGISFGYNFQGEGTDYTNHVVSAKYTYKF